MPDKKGVSSPGGSNMMIRPERSRSRGRKFNERSRSRGPGSGGGGRSRSRGREIGNSEHDFHDHLEGKKWWNWWALLTTILTFWIPDFLLSSCGGMKDKRIRAAWREKVALCIIIFWLCIFLAFITFGLSILVCRPPTEPVFPYSIVKNHEVTDVSRWFIIHGLVYNLPTAWKPYAHSGGLDPYSAMAGLDISAIFPWTPACSYAGAESQFECRLPSSILDKVPASQRSQIGGAQQCHDPNLLNDMDLVANLAFEWSDVEEKGSTKMVYNGEVLDISIYLDQVKDPSKDSSAVLPFGRKIDSVLRSSIGGDASRAFASLNSNMRMCLVQHFRAGLLEVKSLGCIITDIVLYISLVAILGLVMTKFFLAVTFAFVMTRLLGRPPASDEDKEKEKEKKKRRNGDGVGASEGKPAAPRSRYAAVKYRPYQNMKLALASQKQQKTQQYLQKLLNNEDDTGLQSKYQLSPDLNSIDGAESGKSSAEPKPKEAAISKGANMYTMLLVTCYSEDEEGLRVTLDSLTELDYQDERKLIVIIADGIVQGHGNEQSTPDIIISMLELAHEECFEGHQFDSQGRPNLQGYIAIADGIKRFGMARVYAGHYRSGGHRVPVVCVVKCGGPSEVGSAKPGNRGKRDSQIILMSFLHRVLFDDRMSPLEYDLFWKIFRLTGVMPDQYEAVLMVDADTKVMPTALSKLVAVLSRDDLVMGLCGETRIANKSSTWVSMIQVFEYYISHHLSKAFESVFGGVTCLPGCFCMYRIKAPKNDGWVPILSSPDIVDTYSENVTETLHEKNLLLLGEDRYLTTLMLKTFPKRKLVFVPQAVCKTVVPESFRVLLSQRRRWINSTIHNLFELVMVSDLCGIFCCSMQFVVFMELVGTLVLPAAIAFTGVLIASTFLSDPQWIPLFLLGAILGLPALLILFTTRKLMDVVWFVIYLVALPIWNFLLPVYAFWHFDDFSWGQTRKLTGSQSSMDHEMSEGKFDNTAVQMRRWQEWEAIRLWRSENWVSRGGGLGVSGYAPVLATLDDINEAIEIASENASLLIGSNGSVLEKGGDWEED